MSWDDEADAIATLAPPQPYGDVSLFHASLAGFCRAELPLPQALHNLRDDLARGPLRDECAAMARELESGVPFAEAYGRRADEFPAVYRALVEAGLQTGDLPGVLDEIATDASLRERVRHQLRRRLEYPLVAALVVFVLGAVVTVCAAPMFPTISNTNGVPVPLSSSPTVLMVLSGVALLALLALLCLGVAVLRKPLDPGAGPRGLLFRLPLIGRLRSYAAKAGFASTMALLLRRHVPLPRALELCAAGCDGREVREQVERMAACASNGASVAESIRAGDLIPGSLLWFVESASSSEASAQALSDVAAVYRQRLQRATDRVAVFALPIVELVIGLAVLAFALAYVAPAYSLFDKVFVP